MAQPELNSVNRAGQAVNARPEEGDSKEIGKKIKKIVFTILPYIPVVFWSLITLFPFMFMVIMATKATTQIFSNPPPIYFGSDWFTNLSNNYNNLQSQIPFWRNIWNSVYIAAMAMILTVLMASLGGYGFAMYEFKAKNWLMKLMIWSMAIPGILTIIPIFSLMKFLGWINQPRAVWATALANAYGVYLMTQYTKSAISKDLVDAARIDGCSEIGIFWRVVLPLVKPMLGSLAILTFLSSWNSFFLPLVVLQDRDKMTAPIALNTLRGFASVDWGAVMLGSAIAVIPIGIIFLMMSKWIIAGMTEGAVKE